MVAVLSAANCPAPVLHAELVKRLSRSHAVFMVPSSGGRGPALVSLVTDGVRAGVQIRSAGRASQMEWWRFGAEAGLEWLMSQAEQIPRPAGEPVSPLRR